MVNLTCPLCCNETFSSSSSLKCHILEILENLLCPVCHRKFDSLLQLAEHLSSDCSSEIEDNQLRESDGGGEHDDANSDLEHSILAKALLEGTKQCKSEPPSEDSQYYCQTCDVNFNDIDAHLSEYHEGQEIIVEEETVDSTDADAEDPVVLIVNSLEEEADQEPQAPKKLNTIIEQDVKDKDGRLYTRKFVKIDKFWLQDAQIKTETKPFIEKYVIQSLKEETDGTKQTENELEVTVCEICKKYVPADNQHDCEQKFTPKKIYNCEVCNTTFPTFKSLRLHRRMHEPIKSREIKAPVSYEEGDEPLRQMFVCKICHKTYDKEYEQVHMSSHDHNDGFNCEVCNRKFFTKSNLEMHIKAHSNNKKFTCSYCKKPFVTYNALDDHLLNQCQRRPYACQYCGRRFTRPHEKVKHERIHTGEKPHVCDICGKAFRVSYCLTLHLRTHSGTRPYQCKHCGKRFKSHSVYNHHLLTHSDVRAYKCPYCPKAFKTGVQLAGHKNSHIKPFTCTQCNRPFASLYAVRAHMETHKRDNNLKYECWMCGALYSRAFALRDHLKQQHQQVDSEKGKSEVVGAEEMEAANSILVNEDDIILGLDETASIEIIENEGE